MRSLKKHRVKTTEGYIFWECMDTLMIGTTTDIKLAMQFMTTDAAELFCMKNNIDNYTLEWT